MSTKKVMVLDKPEVGLSSILALLLTFAVSMPLWIGALADDLTPLGVSPEFWVWATVASAAFTVFIRQAQATVTKWAAYDKANPSKGISTYLGFGVAGLMELPAFLSSLDEATKPLNVDPQVWVKAGLVVTAVTGFGRVAQSAVAIYNRWRGQPQPIEPAPTEPGGTETPPPIEPGPPIGG